MLRDIHRSVYLLKQHSVVAEQLANTLTSCTLDVIFGRLVGCVLGSKVRSKDKQGL